MGLRKMLRKEVVRSRARANRPRVGVEAMEKRLLLSTAVRAAADAYVYENQSAANFGTAATLEVKESSTTHDRWSYLRFSLTDVPDVASAKLRLYGRVHENAGSTANVAVAGFSSSNVSWSETGITWSNKPAADATTLDTETITYNNAIDQWWEWDVGGYVAQQKAAGATAVTLVLKGAAATDPRAVFNSDEATGNRPELVLTPTADFVQNVDGLASMEAENRSGDLAQSHGGTLRSWSTYTATAGYSGTSALQATPDNSDGTIVSAADALAGSPRMDFAVNFNRTGDHYVWVRGYGADGFDESVHVGLDGQIPSTADNVVLSPTGDYIWKGTDNTATRLTVNIATTGVHTLSVWMREDGVVVDKLVVTSDSAYTPTGTGPAETTGNAAPTIEFAAAARAAPEPEFLLLSALGADDGGEAALTYTWVATSVPSGAPAVEFGSNGTNSASGTVVALGKAGAYTFQVTISDGALSTTSSVTTTVSQVTTRIEIGGAGPVHHDGSRQYTATAYDQFAAVVSPAPAFSWSVGTGGPGGTIDSNGNYTAPPSGGGNDPIDASDPGAPEVPPGGTDAPVGYGGGTVFSDFNQDGIQGSDEPGLAGWEVYIDNNENGQKDADDPGTTTDQDGHYAISQSPSTASADLRCVAQGGNSFTSPASGKYDTISAPAQGVFYNFGVKAEAGVLDVFEVTPAEVAPGKQVTVKVKMVSSTDPNKPLSGRKVKLNLENAGGDIAAVRSGGSATTGGDGIATFTIDAKKAPADGRAIQIKATEADAAPDQDTFQILKVTLTAVAQVNLYKTENIVQGKYSTAFITVTAKAGTTGVPDVGIRGWVPRQTHIKIDSPPTESGKTGADGTLVFQVSIKDANVRPGSEFFYARLIGDPAVQVKVNVTVYEE